MKKTFTFLVFLASYFLYSQGIQALDGSNIFYRYATVYDWDCCLLGPGYNDGQPYNYLVDGHFKIMYDDFGQGTVVEATGSYETINPVGSAYNSSFGTSSLPDYNSLVTNSNCCNELGDKIYVQLSEQIILSTNQEVKKSFIIYPNPTKDFINISTQEKIKSAELYDISGKLLSISKDSNQISVSNCSNGIYLLKIKLEDAKTETMKVIKQ
jgi:hypothetical protein